jgi:DNA-binding beta-propeller fold protein YncE
MSKIVLLLLFVCSAASLLQAQRQITGRLSSPVLNEVSGVAVSQRHQNILYVHNDSGDSSRFFAINTEGKLITTYYFKAKLNGFAGVLDCEDIAVGAGSEKGQSYIYLADIGDNLGWRSTLQVYRFKEPALQPRADTLTAAILNLTYPNGKHDAETILIDPMDKLICIISKREDSVGVYTCALNFKNNDNVVLQQKCKLHFDNKGKKNWIVSGAISADGTQVLLKSLEHVYYWKRLDNEPIYKTLQRNPIIQTAFVSHGQEEGIAFSPDGNSYYVTAEGAGSAIFYYRLEK